MNSIDIITNPHLKGLEALFPRIPGIPSPSIIKITQFSSHLYLPYQPNPDLAPGTCQLPLKLCELNNIRPGSAHVSIAQAPTPCTKAVLYVSELDWQVINNRAARLEEEFLNQVSIVWNKAKMALYYDASNYVQLRVECAETVGVLGENSEL